MSYYTKIKKDFSFRKIKFKGIECYEGDGSSIRVTVTGTAQMIRQILKSEYKKYNAEGTWVQTRKFANGNAIDVYLNRFPEDVYKAIKADLDVFDSYAVNHQNAQRVEIKTDDGLPIDANTKYLHVYNEPPYGSKEKNEPQPDWDKILSSNKKTESSASQPKTSFNRGELIRECSGWKVYKKTLPDGRIVYNAVKDKETAPNKGDWNAIKGEIYIETGFKWGRFGAFEKWGEITESRGEQGVLDALCDILNKYYKSEETTTQTTTQTTTPETTPEEITPFKEGDLFVYVDQKDYTYSINKIKDGFVYGGWSNDVNGRTGSYPAIPIQKMKNDFQYGNAILKNKKEQTSEKQNFIINESYKSIPANPKLEYCKINWAEGIIGYSESFPKEFTSFTALTKYIADNIGQVPKVGYDKHGVEWKWKFEDESVTDRWDVSEKEANPLKYPNLYISERMQNWCYDAWAINPSQNVLHETDKFYSEKVGKDGSEINNEQFNNMLNGFLTYYEEDKKRFKYNTPESRLNAFKTAYPKIYALFQTEETANKKEQIQKAIAGLQILADKGNEKAQKAIIGLQYLLNK